MELESEGEQGAGQVTSMKRETRLENYDVRELISNYLV